MSRYVGISERHALEARWAFKYRELGGARLGRTKVIFHRDGTVTLFCKADDAHRWGRYKCNISLTEAHDFVWSTEVGT